MRPNCSVCMCTVHIRGGQESTAKCATCMLEISARIFPWKPVVPSYQMVKKNSPPSKIYAHKFSFLNTYVTFLPVGVVCNSTGKCKGKGD